MAGNWFAVLLSYILTDQFLLPGGTAGMFLSLKVAINRLGCLDWTSNVSGLRAGVCGTADPVRWESNVGLDDTCSGRFFSDGSSSAGLGLTEDVGAEAMNAWCQYFLLFLIIIISKLSEEIVSNTILGIPMEDAHLTGETPETTNQTAVTG